MRVSTSLYIRNLLSKLHPPPAASPTQREAKQLLNILDASFRRRLDDIHPAPQALSRNERFTNNGPSESAYSASSATSFLFDSVLRHPLLAEKTAENNVRGRRATIAVSRFEQMQIGGTIDNAGITDVARLYLNAIKCGERLEEDRELGLRIASWFSNAAGSSKQLFLTDFQVLNVVVPVMYADGMEEVVWDWLGILYRREWSFAGETMGAISLRNPELLEAEDGLVALMIVAALRQGLIQDAAQQFIKACEYRAASGRGIVESGRAITSQDYHPLIQSWRKLAASVLHRRKSHGLPATLFDSMLKYSVPFLYHPTTSKAFLNIYHPDSPSAESLHHELQSPLFVEAFLSWPQGRYDSFQKMFLITILDAAQLSLDQNQPSQANFLLNFAEKHYSRFISTRTETNTADRLERVRQEVEPKLTTNFQVAIG